MREAFQEGPLPTAEKSAGCCNRAMSIKVAFCQVSAVSTGCFSVCQASPVVSVAVGERNSAAMLLHVWLQHSQPRTGCLVVSAALERVTKFGGKEEGREEIDRLFFFLLKPL